MLPRITGDPSQRAKISAAAQILASVGTMVINMATPAIAQHIGWTSLSVIYAAVAAIFMLVMALVVKENLHTVTDFNEDTAGKSQSGFKKGIPALLKSKYFYLLVFIYISSMGVKIGMGIGSGLVGWLLAFGGYAAGAAVQQASVLTVEKWLLAGVPALCAVGGFILCLFIDVEKRMMKIKETK
jgi:Na+/melibiose symporter-like transporter